MNVYDQVHNLSRAIKESQEYVDYIEIKKEIDGNPDLKKIIDDYHAKQLELQQKQIMGEELTPETLQAAQQLSEILSKDPKTLEFMQKELRFSVMMSDVYNILNEIVAPSEEKND